jgi:hypothetical protein
VIYLRLTLLSYIFNRALAMLLVCVLSTVAVADDATYIRNQVSQMPPGTLIAIRFADGSKAQGYLTQVDADGFSFRAGDRKLDINTEPPSTQSNR